MINIKDFNKFNGDLLLESIENGETQILFSDELRKLLENMDSPIATRLLLSERNPEHKTKMTFIGIDHSKTDSLTFIMSNKLKDTYNTKTLDFEREKISGDVLMNLYPNLDSGTDGEDNEKYWVDRIKNTFFNDNDLKNRSSIKINKFINSIFNNDYVSVKLTDEERKKNKENGILSKAQELSIFVEEFKAARKPGDFELVKGDDIVEWYKRENYTDEVGVGDLHGSCMAKDYCSNFTEFYAINDDKVSLLIMKDPHDEDKIVGRALVWELSVPENRIFMDRIYSSNPHDDAHFKNYAKDNGWLYKFWQNSTNSTFIYDPKTGEKEDGKLLCVEGIRSAEYYPYLDTLSYYNPRKELLTNDWDALEKTKKYGENYIDGFFITLESQEGGPTNLYTDKLRIEWVKNQMDEYSNFGEDITEYYKEYEEEFWDNIDDEEVRKEQTEMDIDNAVENWNGEDFDDDSMIIFIRKNIKKENYIEHLVDEDDEENEKSLNDLDGWEMKDIIEENNLTYDFIEDYVSDRYDGQTARQIEAGIGFGLEHYARFLDEDGFMKSVGDEIDDTTVLSFFHEDYE